MKKDNAILLALVILAIAASAFIYLQPKTGAFGSAHDHADFAVFINGEKIDFSLAKYQSKVPDDPSLCGDTSKLSHLHAGDGNVVHKHATGVTWQYFLGNLNITLEKNCITINLDDTYCTNKEDKLSFIENGKEVSELGEIKDLSKVLISYGTEDLQAQYAQVTDEAKLQGKGASCSGEGSNHSHLETNNTIENKTAHQESHNHAHEFNETQFITEYFKAVKMTFSRNLTLEDLLPLENAAAGAPDEAIEELEEAHWFIEHNLAEHSIHSVTNAYTIAIKNETLYCLPHEADHIYYYTEFNESERITHASSHLAELLTEYEKVLNQFSNVSKTYAAVDQKKVEEQTQALIQQIQEGSYNSQAAQNAVEYLRKQPC